MSKLIPFHYLLLVLLLASCSSNTASLAGFLPKAGAISGWKPEAEAQVYNRDNLYNMVNGQADAFFVYSFEQVVIQRYQNPAGLVLEVAIWQLTTPADAYGLFTSGLAGEPTIICPAATPETCREGDVDPGWRVAFWQDHYYVQIYGRQQLPEADLQAFAQAISATLPPGGEPPDLVSRLPEANLVERGFIFFHEEISIQNEIWLGGENILDLSPQTNGLLARYDLDGTIVYLLLIQYPEAGAAEAGLAALKATRMDNLVVANAHDDLLGAVFGQVEPDIAGSLLASALEEQ